MSFGRFSRIPDRINVTLPTDDEGFLGRECPKPECEGYFKIKPGTGLSGKLPCHCPYCGHSEGHDHFATKEQVGYVKSVAHRRVTEAVREELKAMEFDIKPKGMFGIGISMKLKPGQPIPLRQYRERTLETVIVCNNCTLVYAVYGVFAFCPDCREHNSFQTLEKNVALVHKQITLAEEQADEELKRHLLEDALENCVSAFDGFGRETVKVHAALSVSPQQCNNLSFQNLVRSTERLRILFGIDLSQGIDWSDWQVAHIAFMRRHVLAHRAGVVDRQYIDETKDQALIVGRRVIVKAADVQKLAEILLQVAQSLVNQFARLAPSKPNADASSVS
jgi:hypothetical protein